MLRLRPYLSREHLKLFGSPWPFFRHYHWCHWYHFHVRFWAAVKSWGQMLASAHYPLPISCWLSSLHIILYLYHVGSHLYTLSFTYIMLALISLHIILYLYHVGSHLYTLSFTYIMLALVSTHYPLPISCWLSSLYTLSFTYIMLALISTHYPLPISCWLSSLHMLNETNLIVFKIVLLLITIMALICHFCIENLYKCYLVWSWSGALIGWLSVWSWMSWRSLPCLEIVVVAQCFTYNTWLMLRRMS
jgi:hypothetical protein